MAYDAFYTFISKKSIYRRFSRTCLQLLSAHLSPKVMATIIALHPASPQPLALQCDIFLIIFSCLVSLSDTYFLVTLVLLWFLHSEVMDTLGFKFRT